VGCNRVISSPDRAATERMYQILAVLGQEIAELLPQISLKPWESGPLTLSILRLALILLRR